jgi:hypothetical protein
MVETPEQSISPEEAEPSDPKQTYREWLDMAVDARLEAIDQIPPEKRVISALEDYGFREQIKPDRDIPPDSATSPDRHGQNRTWKTEYFFDFDDMLFDTTGYQNASWEVLERSGIPKDVTLKLYEESKSATKEGAAPMYHPEVHRAKLTEQYPDKAAEIDAAFSATDPQEFVDQGMANLLRLLTSTKVSRVHILTYGELAYQRSKVEAVIARYGVPMDVLYAQVPKAEFLSRYLPERYPYVGSESNSQSFLAVDDNPAELGKLVELGHRVPFFVPVRLRNPYAKRAHVDQQGEPALEVSDAAARTLFNVSIGLHRLRTEHPSIEEWKTADVRTEIQDYIDEAVSEPETVEFERTEAGTLRVRETTRLFGDSGPLTTSEHEIKFDEESRTLLELSRASDGTVQSTREYLPNIGEALS